MWASGNAERAEDLFSSSYVNHQESDVAGGVSARSLAEWKALLAGHHAAFSSVTTRVPMQIAEGDMVATRWEFSGTNTGAYTGRPPTGRTVTWTGVHIDRIAGGRIEASEAGSWKAGSTGICTACSRHWGSSERGIDGSKHKEGFR